MTNPNPTEKRDEEEETPAVSVNIFAPAAIIGVDPGDIN